MDHDVRRSTKLRHDRYVGIYGSYYVNALPRPETLCRVDGAVLTQVDGNFNDRSPINLASLTDGTSDTLVVAERALSPQREAEAGGDPPYDRFGWSISGNWDDTLATSFFPPNLYKKLGKSSGVEAFFRRV